MLEVRSFITGDSNPCVNREVGNLCVPLFHSLAQVKITPTKGKFKPKMNILLDYVIQLKHYVQYEPTVSRRSN